jgi:hypothetical protein
VAHPQIAAFARLANGGSPPVRVIAGQSTKLSRTMHDIRYDAVHDEIFVANPFAQAILTFRGSATGEEPPIRIIQGPHTQMQTPDTLEVDPIHNEVFVPDVDGIRVYRRDAQGDTAPLRILRSGRGRVAVDPVHNLLATGGNMMVDGKRQNGIFIFNRTDEGDAKPKAVISGPKTGLLSGEPYKFYPEGGFLVVAQATLSYEPEIYFDETKDIGFVGIWSINDNGDVPPRWRIDNGMHKPRGVAYNARNKELYVVDMRLNALLTYSLPEMFETATK